MSQIYEIYSIKQLEINQNENLSFQTYLLKMFFVLTFLLRLKEDIHHLVNNEPLEATEQQYFTTCRARQLALI